MDFQMHFKVNESGKTKSGAVYARVTPLTGGITRDVWLNRADNPRGEKPEQPSTATILVGTLGQREAFSYENKEGETINKAETWNLEIIKTKTLEEIAASL